MPTEWIQGLRALRRQPMMTLLAILTLGLGIGATTTIFTVVHSVLVKPLPYTDSHRLVSLYAAKTDGVSDLTGLSGADFVDFRRGLEGIDRLDAYRWSGLTLTSGDRPAELATMLVTPGLLAHLSPTHLGRTFTEAEGTPGSGNVVVLSHALWQREFGGDSSLLNQSVQLDNTAYTVVGVMPPGFSFPFAGIDAWAPWVIGESLENRDGRYVAVLGRLAQGVSLEMVDQEARQLAAGLAAEYPDTNQGWTAVVRPLHDEVVGNARPPLLALMIAVVLVLAIACANVANLLLAHGVRRRQEMALRSVLGAGRRRLVRQLLSESLVLAGLGGAFGIALAQAGVALIVRLRPADLPRAEEIAIDPAVLVFALLMTLATGLGFGILPALRTAGHDLAGQIRDGGRGGESGPSGHRLRGAIIVGQITLSVVLLVGAALFVRSFQRLTQVEPGFTWQNRAAVQIFAYGDHLPGPEQQRQFFTRLQEELEALPGVGSAAGINTLPLSPINGGRIPVKVQGRTEPEAVQAGYRVVTPGYFETLDIPSKAGRLLNETDGASASPVALLNETAANLYFPEGNALGALLVGDEDNPPTEIVGVVQDIRHRSLSTEPMPEIYLPFEQNVSGTMSMVIAVDGDAAALLQAMEERVWAVNPLQPIWATLTLESLVDKNMAPQRVHSVLASLFAAVALLLAAIGLYGVLSYSVAQRTREIGLRIAIGARTSEILSMVLRGGTLLVGVGLVAGLVLSGVFVLLFSRLLTPLLFGMEAQDPSSFLLACGLMVLAGFVACLVPAWRACRVDPNRTLRYE